MPSTQLTRIKVTVMSTESGDLPGGADGVLPKTMTGRLVSIEYVKGTYEDDANFSIKVKRTQEDIWVEDAVNASAIKYPLRLCQGVDGVYLAAVYVPIVLVDDQLEITVTGGGTARTGDFVAVFEEQVY